MKHFRNRAPLLALYVPLLALPAHATPDDTTQGPNGSLSGLSLEQLGNIEVNVASKELEEVWSAPAAIYVITQEDIRRSGATSIPDILRPEPGVGVSRIDSDHWAVGILRFGSQFSTLIATSPPNSG